MPHNNDGDDDCENDYFLLRPSNFSLFRGAGNLVAFKVFTEENGRFVSSTLYLPRSGTIPAYPLQHVHSHFNRGNTLVEASCATVSTPGIFRVHKHLAAFSASIMRKRSPRREEEYNFLNLARQCLLHHRDIERERLVTWARATPCPLKHFSLLPPLPPPLSLYV